jgi:general secretion pathway protein F
MQYEVRALHKNTVASVIVEALSDADARSQIAARSMQPLSVRAAGRNWFSKPGAARIRLSLTLFSQELLALLEGGLSIVDALEVLYEKEARPTVRSLYGLIVRGLKEGKSFSACLNDLPDLFPPLYAGMVRSAEKTSGLTHALSRFIDYQTRLDVVRNKIVSASIYPAILLIVGLGVIGFLSGYVVPRFASVYHDTGRSLPLMSSWLLAWGGFARSHGNQLLLGVAIVVAGAWLLLRAQHRNGGLGRLIRSTPFVAERVKIYELTRLYLTLGMLLEGGLPIVETLGLTRGALSPHLRANLDRATREIVNGESLTDAFRPAGRNVKPVGALLRWRDKPLDRPVHQIVRAAVDGGNWLGGGPHCRSAVHADF